MEVQLTFDFDVQLLRSIFLNNTGATAITPVQESYTLAQEFPQVQSERERTLVHSPQY